VLRSLDRLHDVDLEETQPLDRLERAGRRAVERLRGGPRSAAPPAGSLSPRGP
jgi:hypothetical protein